MPLNPNHMPGPGNFEDRRAEEQEERDFRREEPEFPEDDYDYERWDR